MTDPKAACRYIETELQLSEIRLDPSLQPREQIDEQAVRDYADDMGREGIEAFPNVVVFDDGSEFFLVDGFHRYKAANSLGHQTIHCRVYSGSKLQAHWFACGCNRSHGLRRSTADKQRAVDCALRCDPTKSDSEIARHVGVCGKTVGKYRENLQSTSEIPKSTHRVGSDGRSVNTTNIGNRTKRLAPKPTPRVDQKPSEQPNQKHSGVDSTTAAKPTCGSSKQAHLNTVSAALSPQPADDFPLQIDSWDQLRDWLLRRIEAEGREAVCFKLRNVLETLDFPIEPTDVSSNVRSELSVDKTPPQETADGGPPATVVVQDWISVRMERTDEEDP